jgi:hypothetical protein
MTEKFNHSQSHRTVSDQPDVRTMSRPRFRPERRRVALLLLAFGILATVAWVTKYLADQRQTRIDTVAKAEIRLMNAQGNLNAAARSVDLSAAVMRNVGLTNSRVNQAIDAVGSSVVQRLQIETISASIDLEQSRTAVAADHRLQGYSDLQQAQLAAVTLILCGIDGAVIRTAEDANSTDNRPPYELMVPNALAERAADALRTTRISELRQYANPIAAIAAMKRVKQRGIPASILPLKASGQRETAQRTYALYVRLADEESAKASLTDSTAPR